MSAPLGYASDCGPRAVASVLRMTPEDAAALLWPLRSLWHDPRRVRPADDGTFGTPERAVEDLLLRAGCAIDFYAGDGRLLADTGVLAAMLRREAHERVTTVRRAPEVIAPTVAPTEASPPSWFDELRTLGDWLERHRAGHWLYMLTDGLGAHVVAAWGPQVLVGDECGRYQAWRVYSALRVIPPRTA